MMDKIIQKVAKDLNIKIVNKNEVNLEDFVTIKQDINSFDKSYLESQISLLINERDIKRILSYDIMKFIDSYIECDNCESSEEIRIMNTENFNMETKRGFILYKYSLKIRYSSK